MNETFRVFRSGDRTTAKDSKPPETKITLTANPTLDLIVCGLEEITPDCKSLIAGLSDTQKAKLSSEKNGILFGKLAEMHVWQVLTRLAEGNSLIKIDPIPSGHETKNYRFEQSGHNVIVYKRHSSLSCVEYDMLTEIDGLPVIWEVKSGSSLSNAVSSQRVKTITRPLIQYYGKNNFGYVVVGPKYSSEPTKAQQRFTRNQGIIARVPITKIQFESEIMNANGNGNGNGSHS